MNNHHNGQGWLMAFSDVAVLNKRLWLERPFVSRDLLQILSMSEPRSEGEKS
jgi:hypothetical protein